MDISEPVENINITGNIDGSYSSNGYWRFSGNYYNLGGYSWGDGGSHNMQYGTWAGSVPFNGLVTGLKSRTSSLRIYSDASCPPSLSASAAEPADPAEAAYCALVIKQIRRGRRGAVLSV